MPASYIPEDDLEFFVPTWVEGYEHAYLIDSLEGLRFLRKSHPFVDGDAPPQIDRLPGIGERFVHN